MGSSTLTLSVVVLVCFGHMDMRIYDAMGVWDVWAGVSTPSLFFVATNAGNFYGGSMMRSSTGFGYSMLTHSIP